MNKEAIAECERSMNVALEGSNGLSDEQVMALELKLGEDPHDLDSRFRLLGHYTSCRFNSSQLVQQRNGHIAWLIHNYPNHLFLGYPFAEMVICIDGLDSYEEMKLHWLRQVESNDTNVAALVNAAHFFLRVDKELAEQCLVRADAIDPGNEYVLADLALFHKIWRRRDPTPHTSG